VRPFRHPHARHFLAERTRELGLGNPASKVAEDANYCPAKVSHQARKVTVIAGGTLALRDVR
jgi:hypothetical protein